MVETEATLIKSACEGDRTAFDTLTSRHWDYVLNVVRGYIQDEHHATDVVQETFLTAWRTLRNFEGRSAFRSWLYGIAQNKALKRRGNIARTSAIIVRVDLASVSRETP